MATSKSRKGGRASWSEIIATVQTPLGFFALIVLVVEAIFGGMAAVSSGTDRTYLVLGMLAIMLSLILIVAVLAFIRPESLHGQRPASRTVVLAQTQPANAQPFASTATATSNEWYSEWRLGRNETLYTEFLTLHIEQNGTVTGKRRVESRSVTTYMVVGFTRGAFLWLEYHDPERSGGGTLLLKEFTSGRLRGFITSIDCDNGRLRCYLNSWVPVVARAQFDRSWQKLIGEISETEGL